MPNESIDTAPESEVNSTNEPPPLRRLWDSTLNNRNIVSGYTILNFEQPIASVPNLPARHWVSGALLLVRSVEGHDAGELHNHVVQAVGPSYHSVAEGVHNIRYISYDSHGREVYTNRSSARGENLHRYLNDAPLAYVSDIILDECVTPISVEAARRLCVEFIDEGADSPCFLTICRNQSDTSNRSIRVERDGDSYDYFTIPFSSAMVLFREIEEDEEEISRILSEYPANVLCETCGDPIDPMSDSRTHLICLTDSPATMSVCSSCYRSMNTISRCSTCDRMIYNPYGDSPVICFECSRTYQICHECGRSVRRSRMYTNDDGNLVCADCSPEHNPIRSYNWRPLKPKFHGNGPLFFGIEVEVERLPGTKAREALAAEFMSNLKGTPWNNLFYIKHDGSLENGWEVVSSPFSMQFFRKNRKMLEPITNLKSTMIADGVSTCGLHVHMSAKAFSTLHLYRFLKVVYRNKAFVLAVAGRESERFASFSIPESSIGRKSQRLLDDAENHDYKYTAVNTTNANTIEMRVFSGTLDADRISGCIEFCHALYSFTKGASVAYCTRAKFLDFVCSRPKSYVRLIKILTDAGYKTEGRK